jgi:hypothetical protein
LPKPRAVTRPPAPTADEVAFERVRALFQPLIDWKEAVHREAWRLARADGGNHCTEEHFALARNSLIEQGVRPPPGYSQEYD